MKVTLSGLGSDGAALPFWLVSSFASVEGRQDSDKDRGLTTMGSDFSWWWNEHVHEQSCCQQVFKYFLPATSPPCWTWLCYLSTHLLAVTRLIIEGSFPTQHCQGHLFSVSTIGLGRTGLNCFFKNVPLLLTGLFFLSAFFLFFYIFIVVQVQLSPFSLQHTPPPTLLIPTSHPRNTPFGFVHVTFICSFMAPPLFFPHYPFLPSPLVTVSLFFISMSLVICCLLVFVFFLLS